MSDEALGVCHREGGERRRERVRIDERDALLGQKLGVAEELCGEVGHRREVALAERAEQPHTWPLAVVQRPDDPLGDLRPDAGGSLRQHVRVAEHRRADDLGWRIRPGSDAVVLDQPPVEGGDLPERDPDLLARADPRRGAVHLVSARDHPLDERTRLAHALDRLGRELHGLRFARHAHDVCNG